MYSLYKQANVGPAKDKDKPSMFRFVAYQKWKSHKALGKMSKEDAMLKYIEEIDKRAPDWRTNSEAAKKIKLRSRL